MTHEPQHGAALQAKTIAARMRNDGYLEAEPDYAHCCGPELEGDFYYYAVSVYRGPRSPLARSQFVWRVVRISLGAAVAIGTSTVVIAMLFWPQP